MKKRIFTDSERAILRRNRLKNLDLAVRIFTVLNNNKIDTLGKLLQYSELQTLKLPISLGNRSGIGKLISNLKEELSKIGLRLRED